MSRAAWLLGLLLAFSFSCSSGGDAEDDSIFRLAPPPVDPRLTVHASGSLDLMVEVGGRQEIDPRALTGLHNIEAPPCERFVFLFSWQVQTSESLSFTGKRRDAAFDIVNGRSGNASVDGCILIETHNSGPGIATGKLRYVIAESG